MALLNFVTQIRPPRWSQSCSFNIAQQAGRVKRVFYGKRRFPLKIGVSSRKATLLAVKQRFCSRNDAFLRHPPISTDFGCKNLNQTSHWWYTVRMKRFRNIKFGPLVTHILISLLYPAFAALRASRAGSDALLAFLDSVTIISFFLLLFGVVYRLALKGDFDRIQFAWFRAVGQNRKPFDAYEEDKKEERLQSFNYLLFLGLVYLIGSIVLSELLYK